MKRIDRRTFVLLASVGASGAVLTACGNTESTDANLNPTMIPDVAGAPPTLAPQATPGGGAAEQQQPAQGEAAQQQPAQGGQQAAGQPQTHVVEMTLQLQFVPEQLTVNVGDTVTWRTVGPIPHTSTCDPSLAANPAQSVALPEGAEPWNSDLVGDGKEFSHTFEVPGEYRYFCIPHEAAGMIASLTVQEAGAAPAAGGGTPAAEASPAAQQQQPAQEGQQAAGQAQTHVVEMNLQLQFVPEQLTVNVGDTVTWRTVGPIPHTSTCDPSLAANPAQSVALPEGAEPWNSDLVGDGKEFSHTFEVPGEYRYFCIPHEAAGMIASLTVQ
jgi:plastocyanin